MPLYRLIAFSSPAAILFCALAGSSAAQTRGVPPNRQRATTPAVSTMRIVVRDQSGNPLDRVRVSVSSGSNRREATTDADGTATVPNLPNGTYRMRFERDGFITLERDIAIRSSQPAAVDVALNAAPAPPVQPLPSERVPPTPPPAAIPAAPSTAASSPPGPPVNLSIPNFLERNFIGRDPLKESVLACNPTETVRLLQLRDPIAEHSHQDVDEVIYVVAGDGAVRMNAEWTAVRPGWLVLVPRGTQHAMERRGRNPFIVLSTLSGAPCRPASAERR